jgi:hypothetical protein
MHVYVCVGRGICTIKNKQTGKQQQQQCYYNGKTTQKNAKKKARHIAVFDAKSIDALQQR